MTSKEFVAGVAGGLECTPRRAEEIIFAVFQHLRDRLTPKEAHDVGAQMPAALKHLWLEEYRHARGGERLHRTELLERVKLASGLPTRAEAERAVRVVFAALQSLLGSPRGREGEAWDVLSVLPKDLKQLWLDAADPEWK